MTPSTEQRDEPPDQSPTLASATAPLPVIEYGVPEANHTPPFVLGIVWHSIRFVFSALFIAIFGLVLLNQFTHLNRDFGDLLYLAVPFALFVWMCISSVRSIHDAWRGK